MLELVDRSLLLIWSLTLIYLAPSLVDAACAAAEASEEGVVQPVNTPNGPIRVLARGSLPEIRITRGH